MLNCLALQWQEAWAEITATAPGGRITGKHVKSVVARRLAVSTEKPVLQQSLQTSPSSYEIGQLVLIQCEDGMAGQRCRRYSGCWGSVQHVFESAVVVAVGGEMVRYLFCDLKPVENPSPALQEVCDTFGKLLFETLLFETLRERERERERVMSLWRVRNLPSSVQCLLEVFYQKRVDFEQGDIIPFWILDCKSLISG